MSYDIRRGLVDAWRRLSRLIRPFYGEVRVLGGRIRGGATYFTDMETEQLPTAGWWWKGIPRVPGVAMVVGQPYLSRWRELEQIAELDDGLAFLAADEWELPPTRLALVIPDRLAQRWNPTWVVHGGGYTMKWNTEYPPEWPFD